MDRQSSVYYAARKAYQQRNSDGKDCYDEFGQLVTCQSPPSFTFTDAAMPPEGLGDSSVNRYLSDPNPDSEYQRRVILQRHVYDPAISDPDAEWQV